MSESDTQARNRRIIEQQSCLERDSVAGANEPPFSDLCRESVLWFLQMYKGLMTTTDPLQGFTEEYTEQYTAPHSVRDEPRAQERNRLGDP